MKKALFIIFLFLAFAGSIAHAAIITVDNKVPSAGQYSTLQAAHDAAGNGDTIYVSPSLINYTGITVNKQLHIMGTGFDKPAADLPVTNISGTITFSSSAAGSIMEGFGGQFFIIIDADDITIKRNFTQKITVLSNRRGIVILSNKIISNDVYGCIYLNNFTEAMILNNIIKNTSYGGNMYNTYACIGPYSGASISAIINNNILIVVKDWLKTISLSSSQYASATNNIVYLGHLGTAYGIYNLLCCDTASGEGNIQVPDMSTVFVDPANGDFHLKPDSPARGAGQNGVDMGCYGGDSPFVDGGAPGIPSIIQINSSHIGSQEGGLDVTIKAKSNKE